MATPRFFPDSGGVESHVYEVARRLPDLGIQVRVVTTGRERGLAAVDWLDGIRIDRARSIPRRGDVGFAPGAVRALREIKADLLHVQSYHTLLPPLAMSAALAMRTPFVVTFHGGGHSSALRNRLRPVQVVSQRPLLRRAKLLIAVAQFEIAHYGRLLGIGPQGFALIPNGADLPSSASTLARDPNLVVSIGRLERYKGHHRVIEALPHMLEANPDVRLWIAGAGPYEDELHAFADRLGVGSRVEIRGIPGGERERFAQEISKAKVAVLLSDFETNPVAVLEAAALGLVVVVANGSGMAELVDRGLATGTPLGADAPSIAQAIIQALESPPPKIPQLPTWDDCAEELARTYRSVLGEVPASK